MHAHKRPVSVVQLVSGHNGRALVFVLSLVAVTAPGRRCGWPMLLATAAWAVHRVRKGGRVRVRGSNPAGIFFAGTVGVLSIAAQVSSAPYALAARQSSMPTADRAGMPAGISLFAFYLCGHHR